MISGAGALAEGQVGLRGVSPGGCLEVGRAGVAAAGRTPRGHPALQVLGPGGHHSQAALAEVRRTSEPGLRKGSYPRKKQKELALAALRAVMAVADGSSSCRRRSGTRVGRGASAAFSGRRQTLPLPSSSPTLQRPGWSGGRPPPLPSRSACCCGSVAALVIRSRPTWPHVHQHSKAPRAHACCTALTWSVPDLPRSQRGFPLWLQEAAVGVRKSTQKVLEAVDWSKEGEAEDASRTIWRSLRRLVGSGMQRKSFQQLRVLKLAAQEHSDKFWQASPRPARRSIPTDAAFPFRAHGRAAV